MSIRFRCEECGHEIEVGDHFEGKHGHCKHCGRPIVVPEHVAAAEGPLRLRPAEEDEPAGIHDHLLATPADLNVRRAEAEPRPAPVAISDPDDPALARGDDYRMGGPTVRVRHSSAGPPPFWVNIPTLTARSLAHLFRTLRDWGYLVSLAALVMALIGFIAKSKPMLHVGVAVAIAANVEMLVVGVAYLVTLPFKESLHHGLANLIPPYAIYYWYSRWPKMKTPVRKTIGAFLPIALAGLAYFAYEDGAKVEAAVAKEIQVLEGKVERGIKSVEGDKARDIDRTIDRVLEPSGDGPGEPKGRAR